MYGQRYGGVQRIGAYKGKWRSDILPHACRVNQFAEDMGHFDTRTYDTMAGRLTAEIRIVRHILDQDFLLRLDRFQINKHPLIKAQLIASDIDGLHRDHAARSGTAKNFGLSLHNRRYLKLT